jgi:hypothetical protein
MKKPSIRLSFAALMASMAMVACVQRPVHPTKSQREWVTDHEACEKSVRSEIRVDPDTYDNFDEMRMIRQCMRDKGWRWERTSLFNFNREQQEK